LTLQGLKKIKISQLYKHTLILFSLLFSVSIILGLTAMVFGISDLNLVSEAITALPVSYVIYVFIVRVFLEEWFFRAFLVGRVGVILSSLVFAAGHVFYGSFIEVIGAFVLGVLLSRYYQKTGNIWPNFLAHFLYNIFMYVMMISAI
jgi:membrane protease YdiL (CAAX protease family)